VNWPLERKPWLHQSESFAFAEPNAATMIAAGLGVGKTLIAIALQAAWESKRVLILAPASVRAVWRRELAAHYPAMHAVILDNGSVRERTSEAVKVMAKFASEPTAIVLNYESCSLEPMASWILSQRWSCTILDEAHMGGVQGDNTVTGRFVERLTPISDRRLALSATVLGHYPLRAWGCYRFLSRDVFCKDFRTYADFAKHFGSPRQLRIRKRLRHGRAEMLSAITECYGADSPLLAELDDEPDYTQALPGINHRDEFIQRIKPITWFCESAKVLQLPPLITETREVELGPKARKLYDQLCDRLHGEIDEGEITINSILTLSIRLQQLTSGYIMVDYEPSQMSEMQGNQGVSLRESVQNMQQCETPVSPETPQVPTLQRPVAESDRDYAMPEMLANEASDGSWDLHHLRKGACLSSAGEKKDDALPPMLDREGETTAATMQGQRMQSAHGAGTKGRNWGQGVLCAALRQMETDGRSRAAATSRPDSSGQGVVEGFGIHGNATTGSDTEGEDLRIRPSLGNGEDSREAIKAVRTCPPYQRNQIGQSAGESGALDKVPSDRTAITGHLELACEDIPAATHRSSRLVKIDDAKRQALKDLLAEAGEPCVVFCRFVEDLNTVESVCRELGLRYGELAHRRKDAVTDMAMMSDRIDVAGVQPQSGGVGIDLTRAKVCVWYSFPRSLPVFDQGVGRVHRPGTTGVRMYSLVANDSIDGEILSAIRDRREITTAILDRMQARQIR
jgi:SNF2 family DNA or RNA helicase